MVGQARLRASSMCRIHVEITEGHTWIGTDLRELIGVRHLLHTGNLFHNLYPGYTGYSYLSLNI